MLLALVGFGWLVWTHALWLKDHWVAWQFTPSTELLASVERTKLTDKTVFLAEATQAQFADAKVFNPACRGYEKGGKGAYTTLGCYTSPLSQVYVYRIQDPTIEGIDDVVLVHELLHAAWDRLSSAERTQLTPVIEAAYSTVKTNELEERMQYYDKAEPGERINELHSILATEFATLTPDLETYYARYFHDRQTVVGLYKKYHAPFEALQQKLAILQKRITAAETYLKAQSALLQKDAAAYAVELRALQQARATLDRTSQQAVDAYNARVVDLNRQAASLNQRSAAIRQRYQQYVRDIDSYNATGVALTTLQTALDSTAIPTVTPAQ